MVDYISPSAPQESEIDMDDRLDAARALLGVSPSSVTEGGGAMSLSSFGGRGFIKPTTLAPIKAETETKSTDSEPIVRRPRSNSAGLDALALMATQEQASLERQNPPMASGPLNGAYNNSSAPVVASTVSSSCSSSSDDDSEAMPPPPPRINTRRPRSVSNPEGMERWAPRNESRLHFVLPASILEEELAEANAAMRAKSEALPKTTAKIIKKDSSKAQVVEHHEPQEDDSKLDQEALLRRARSRLLEDLSEGNLNGDKGVLTLPHSLAKYKDVYNKNGRIGIYTPAERAAIINRFNSKRSRRVWNKKIRYNCRKNLADRRMRVKGRFVKRSTEQLAKSKAATAPMNTVAEESSYVTPEPSENEDTCPPATDQDMPDVNDPEAGFCPTEDQPYRRLRRHTIT